MEFVFVEVFGWVEGKEGDGRVGVKSSLRNWGRGKGKESSD